MNRRLLVPALFAGLLLTSNAHAAGKPWLGFTAGFDLPSGSFSDVATSGWNAGSPGITASTIAWRSAAK